MPSAAEFEHSKCLSVGKAALHGKRVQRVAPFPNLPRKDNNGENKATGTQSYKYLQVEMFFQIAALLRRGAGAKRLRGGKMRALIPR